MKDELRKLIRYRIERAHEILSDAKILIDDNQINGISRQLTLLKFYHALLINIYLNKLTFIYSLLFASFIQYPASSIQHFVDSCLLSLVIRQLTVVC